MNNILKWFGIAVGGLAGFVGRFAILAYYRRGIQHATDVYIKTVGFGILCFFATFFLNYAFMLWLWLPGQIALGLALPFIGMYYWFAPAISVPVVALMTADTASAPGDQENLPMIVSALKRYGQVLGLVIVWESIYVFATIASPAYLSPSAFWIAHYPIVVILGLLMAGKIHVSQKLYDWIYRLSCGLLVVILGLMLVFQQDVAKMNRMAQTKQALAKLYSEVGEKKDSSAAALVKKLHVKDDGGIVELNDANGVIDGTPTLKKAEQAIKAESPLGKLLAPPSHKEGGAQHTSGESGLGGQFLGYWSYYLAQKDTNPFLFWSSLFIGHIVLFWVLRAIWRWWKDEKSETTSTKVVKNGMRTGTVWLLAIALTVLGYYGYNNFIPRSEATIAQVRVTPEYFITPREAPDYTAFVVGPITDEYYQKQMTLQIGDWVNQHVQGGYNLALYLKGDPRGDIQLSAPSACNKNWMLQNVKYTKCDGGMWSQGNVRSSYIAYFNGWDRFLVLSSPQGEITIKLVNLS